MKTTLEQRFPEASWRAHAGLAELLDALGAQAGDVRFVGGFVRDTLLGLETSDVDCATRLAPEEVSRRIVKAGFKAVPTGIAHGTVTAVLPSGPVEITTLRRDVATDGRHATIAYTDDWREDAARRDFTINALSADPASGIIHDYFGGRADLAAGIVRFIGDPLKRIAEDHLRILRFFRFFARFGTGGPDAAALDACRVRANDLMALSRERIADELLKLLAIADPLAAVRLMLDNGILKPVLPEITVEAADRLGKLIAAERSAGIAPAALRRLSSLLPRDPEVAQGIGARLKLSNAARKRLAAAAGTDDVSDPRRLAYRLGTESAVDRLLLDSRPEDAVAIVDWTVPRLPLTGGALVSRGMKAGPLVAATLRAIEAQWVDEGFPDAERAEAIADEAVRRQRLAG